MSPCKMHGHAGRQITMHVNRPGIDDEYTISARAHAHDVMATLRGAQDTPLQHGVDDVESLRAVEAYVQLADACSKCGPLV